MSTSHVGRVRSYATTQISICSDVRDHVRAENLSLSLSPLSIILIANLCHKIEVDEPAHLVHAKINGLQRVFPASVF